MDEENQPSKLTKSIIELSAAIIVLTFAIAFSLAIIFSLAAWYRHLFGG